MAYFEHGAQPLHMVVSSINILDESITSHGLYSPNARRNALLRDDFKTSYFWSVEYMSPTTELHRHARNLNDTYLEEGSKVTLNRNGMQSDFRYAIVKICACSEKKFIPLLHTSLQT